MTNHPPRLLPAQHAGLQPSEFVICPFLSQGAADLRNCAGAKCAAWSPIATAGHGLCKLIEGRSAPL